MKKHSLLCSVDNGSRGSRNVRRARLALVALSLAGAWIGGCGGTTRAVPSSGQGGAREGSGGSIAGAAGMSGTTGSGGGSSGGIGGGAGGAGDAGDAGGNGSGSAGSAGDAVGADASGGGGAAGAGGSTGLDAGAGGAYSLAAGQYHTCALLTRGAVRCWGPAPQHGHLTNDTIGAGPDESPIPSPSPAAAGDLNLGGDAVNIAAGLFHTCALLSTGAVRCWGLSANGRLGYPKGKDIGGTTEPASAGDVPVGGRVIDIAAGSYHTCAVLETGAVRCWGRNANGQLGYGHTRDIGDDETPESAGDVRLGAKAIAIGAGEGHTCAVLETGAVRCWGKNAEGQLGYGHTRDIGDDETPDSAGDVAVGGKVVRIGGGFMHTCALLDGGRVRCWGSGALGSTGHAATDIIGDDETPAVAGDVVLGGAAVDLASGYLHSCAVLRGGSVVCWGSRSESQLGYPYASVVVNDPLRPNVGDDETPASVGPVKVGGLVARIATGAEHTCVALEAGTVRCWGRARDGRLGYGKLDAAWDWYIGNNEAPEVAGDVPVF